MKKSFHGLLGRPAIVHPLLAPLPALLGFTHDNRHMATWPAVLAPLALTWFASLPVFLLLTLLCRNPRRGAVATTLLIVAFYAHPELGRAAPLMWGAVGAGVVGLALYRGAGDVLTTFANLVIALGVLPGLWVTLRDEMAPAALQVRPGYLEALDTSAGPTAPLPDIWYIVLDGYGREDVLRDLYGIDDGLAAALRRRGFYVADQARSNYSQTALSFASALNMAPLDELLVGADRKTRDRMPVSELIAHNRVTRALRAAGYDIVQYRGEYSMTRLADADATRGPLLHFDEYTYELIGEGTATLALSRLLGQPPNWLCHAMRRHAIDTVLDDLARGDRDPGPTFVYAHIVAPHPPFVYNPDGSQRINRQRGFLGDGSSWRAASKRPEDSYVAGYADQVRYIDRRILEAVDGILADAERTPVILIQGDHGPGSQLDWSSVQATDMRERMGILSAYLVPDSTVLTPTITPINSFRVVLDQVLGTTLPRLEDRSWFSKFATPYAYVDVTLASEPAEPLIVVQ